MSTKITDFIVGLSFDTSEFEKGMKRATSDLGGFRSDILQVGATMAGVFGANALTFDFAQQNDQLRQMSQLLGITANDLYGLTEASKSFGASEGEMAETLSRLASARAEFDRLGKIGIFEDLALIGVDFDSINAARNEVEALYILADQISKLDTRGQMMAANILGLSPQTLDLLKNGEDGVRALSLAMQEARPHTEAMARASRLFVSEWNELMVNLGGRADQFATPLVTALADITKSTNDWFDANRKVIDQKIGQFVEYFADNLNVLAPALAAIAGSGAVATFAGLAKYIPIIGGSIGAVAMGLSRFVPILGALAVAKELWDFDPEKFEKLFGFKAPDWLFKPIGEFEIFDPDRSKASQLLNSTDFTSEEYLRPDTGASFSSEEYLRPDTGASFSSEEYLAGGSTPTVVQSNINLTLELDGDVIAQKNLKLINDGIDATVSNAQSREDR